MTTLPSTWRDRWAAAPDAPVLHDPAHGWITNGELAARVGAAAAVLHGAGLRRGDRVLFLHRSSIELVAFHAAALSLGLVVVPVNPTYSPREIAHIVGDAEPSAMVTDDPGRAGGLMVVPTDAADGDAPDVELPSPEDPGLFLYTSGTTGAPKGAVLSHGNLLASCTSVGEAWRWTAADRLVIALPMFHAHGLGVALHGTLHAGASAVLLPRFDAGAVVDAVVEHDATLFFGVPTMYRRLVDSGRAGALAALRLCVSGSAPLDADLFAEIEAATGHRPLERYGMSETLMNVSNPYDGERRPGSVGLPLPRVEMKLADGRAGEILLKGPNVFGGYWRNEEATRASFTDDGWFHTGDVGELDDDGYLRIVARAKEVIITGGFNVYPREVEEVLAAHPAVAEAAVGSVPSSEWGETVTAYLVPAGDPDAFDVEAVLAWAAEQLAPYKRPRAAHVVGSLPRNALGKVVRHQLATVVGR